MYFFLEIDQGREPRVEMCRALNIPACVSLVRNEAADNAMYSWLSCLHNLHGC